MPTIGFKTFVLLGACLALLSGPRALSAENNAASSAPAKAETTDAAKAVEAPKPGDPIPYVLGPNDVIQIKVYQEEDLDAKERVGQDGNVTLPLLGPVAVAGKTVERATTAIREMLAKDYLVHPQVTISVVEFAKRRFTILGHVQRPGTYELGAETSVNLLQAIATAGGYSRIGSPRKVTVQRLVDGDQKIFRLDAEAMSKDKQAKPFEILPEDTITVGEKIF